MWSTFFPRIVRKGLGANYRGFVFLVLISLLFPLLDKIAQAQQLSWVRQVGGSGQEAYGNSIGIDGSGNVYVTGAFSGTATFREGPSPIILTSSGDADIFVAKYGSDGTLAWAIQAGGTTDDYGVEIAVDSSGNSYVTGFFTGDATFGEVGGTPVNLISNGLWDIFVAKYGPDGTLAWAKKVGGTSYDFGWGIAVDTNSNVYVTGNFYTTATFGDGENQITFTNTGFLDIFVAKYGSDGTLAWAKQIEGSLFAPTIAVEGNGNSYVTGQFSGTATFGELPGQILTSAGSGANTFLAKYDTDGTLAWAKQAGSSMGEGVTVDSSGNSYVTGTFWGTAAFGEPGSQTILTSTYPADAFVAKYGTDGTLVWAKKVCGTGGMYGIGLAVAVDGSGNSYVTGSFLDTATFIEGASQKILTSKGGQDIYVAKYGPNGTLASAIQAGGGANDIGFGIAVSGYWNIYVAGDFRDTATFGEVEGVPVNLTGKGSSDIFLAKYTSGGFVGFFDPIQTGPEVINLVKAGRAIPVKFQLQNESGGFIDDLSAVTEISFQQMVCSDGSLPILLADLGGTETSRSSRLWYDYSTNQFIYLWKTTKDMAGNCYRLNVELFDSEVHSADFQMW